MKSVQTASLGMTAAKGAVLLCAATLTAGSVTALVFTRSLLASQAREALREGHLRAARVAAEALSEQSDAVFFGYARTWFSEGAAVEAVIISPEGKAFLHSGMAKGGPSLTGSPYPEAAWARSSRGPEEVLIAEGEGRLAASCRLPQPHEGYALAVRYNPPAVYRWRDEAVRGLAVRLALAGAALLALAAAGARRFGGGLAAPILDLLGGARRLGTRLDPAPLSLRGPREFRELAGEFNALAARLAESRAALDQLLTGAAHDMRGPLSVLLAAAAELAKAAGKPSEAVQRVKMAAESLRLMVDDLLDAALAREGRSLRLGPVDAEEVVRRARDFYFSEARARGIRLEAELAADLKPVLADAAALERVLGNLILNALRFTPPDGFIALHLEVDGSRARFSVLDSGRGMEPERLPRLAVGLPERKGDPSTPRHLGLGLPLCRTLVEGMGGRLRVSSAPGKGTLVVFSLPWADA